MHRIHLLMDSLGVVKEAVNYFKVTNSVRKQTKEKAESYSGKKCY